MAPGCAGLGSAAGRSSAVGRGWSRLGGRSRLVAAGRGWSAGRASAAGRGWSRLGGRSRWVHPGPDMPGSLISGLSMATTSPHGCRQCPASAGQACALRLRVVRAAQAPTIRLPGISTGPIGRARPQRQASCGSVGWPRTRLEPATSNHRGAAASGAEPPRATTGHHGPPPGARTGTATLWLDTPRGRLHSAATANRGCRSGSVHRGHRQRMSPEGP